jgi:hypothetical protein
VRRVFQLRIRTQLDAADFARTVLFSNVLRRPLGAEDIACLNRKVNEEIPLQSRPIGIGLSQDLHIFHLFY